MSQVSISQQDLLSIQQLTQVVLPKIIQRVKDTEAKLATAEGKIITLEEQVAVLFEGAVKKPARKPKKKEVEVPALVEPQQAKLPVEQSDGDPDAQAWVDSFKQPQDAMPPAPPAIVDGIPINRMVVDAVQHCLNQGAIDADPIAQTLGLPVAVVRHVLNMSMPEKAAVV